MNVIKFEMTSETRLPIGSRTVLVMPLVRVNHQIG